MKNLHFIYRCELTLTTPVIEHYFTLRIIPHDDPSQKIDIETVRVVPCEKVAKQTDGWGNRLYVGSADAEHDEMLYECIGTACVDARCGRGSDDNPVFEVPSPLTQTGPTILKLAQSSPLPDGDCDAEAVFADAVACRQLVAEAMEYTPGATTVATDAEEALTGGKGVCQDYAHILSAVLRLRGIPARYVSGFMLGEGATHAWVEFFDGTTWWGLDPTNDCEAGDSYIVLARGRDASDCPIERGVFFGDAQQTQSILVKVEEADADDPAGDAA
ncbi:MAG: lasso peptide biosynthesis protein [Coriobacteriaceae bacterium]|nr:lasso peptide biosynthesis protein [Coriobacteriaceae bacterium]